MCDQCKSREPSVYVELHHNVGLLLMRKVESTEAQLCLACLQRAFNKHQLTNLVFGWWGVISFFATIYYLVDNTLVFLNARSELRSRAPRAASHPTQPQGSPRDRLAPFRHNVRLRLRAGEPPTQIAEDLARVHDVPLADAEALVAEVNAETSAQPPA